ncbi:MAG: hypothetical protein KGL39_21250 [Patescibacteria group bacterium]|nr:hypothetical protein [Patescibacteria group bacterium]
MKQTQQSRFADQAPDIPVWNNAGMRSLADYLWRVTEFCLARRGEWCLPGMDRADAFRYVAFCQLTGRLWTLSGPHGLRAVVFAWPDWLAHIEARAAEGKGQFSWTRLHTVEGQAVGDTLFVADVIGSRQAVGELAPRVLRFYPRLAGLQHVVTYRRGKLVRLSEPLIERFCRGRRS